MRLSFRCPKCRVKALSVEEGQTFENVGVSDPKHLEWLKGLAKKAQMEKYRYWLCTNERCPNYGVYYQTDLDGKLIKEHHFSICC
jgi:hypothetical protein